LALVESSVKKRPSSRKKPNSSQVGLVGIIFVLGDQVLIESSQLSEAELCAGFANHPGGHEQLWAQLQADGVAPRDEDYIAAPRGRVIFSTQTGYSLLLDRCILRKPKLVREIRERMNLPSRELVVSTDDHYRCAFCMSRSSF